MSSPSRDAVGSPRSNAPAGTIVRTGDVRAGRPPAPSTGRVPVVSGAERRHQRDVLGALGGLADGLEMSGLEDEPQGDPERAAQRRGAADGLRRRAGLNVWTSVRAEDWLISEIRAAI